MYKNSKNIEKITDDIESISSMQDCTGLVARAPADEEEFDNLMNLMKFSPKSIKKKQ